MAKPKIEDVFKLIKSEKYEDAITLIKKQIQANDAVFIKLLAINLNLITENNTELVKEIIPLVLPILDSKNEAIRLLFITNVQKFIVMNAWAVYAYIEPYLNAASAKKREGMLYLLEYIIDEDSTLLNPFYEFIINLINDSEISIQKRTINLLTKIGKHNPIQLKAQFAEVSQAVTDPKRKQKIDEVRKQLFHEG